MFYDLANLLTSKIQGSVFQAKIDSASYEVKVALETENELYSNGNITSDRLKLSIDRVAEQIHGRVIVAAANRNAGIFHLFSVHRASNASAEDLIMNMPRIDAENANSPINIALHQKKDVFADNLKRFENIYPRHIMEHFSRHRTNAFYVTPVIGLEGESWGTVWAESTDGAENANDSNLEHITRTLAHSVKRQVEFFLKQQSNQKMSSALDFLVPPHVAAKIKEGLPPREEETGYLLNVDLSGSTALSKEMGNHNFAASMRTLASTLQAQLDRFGFQLQMIIWDAFIFTRTDKCGPLAPDDIEQLNVIVKSCLQKVLGNYKVGHRGVLHFGDTTRDIRQNSNQGWGIVGSAMAESCKIEAQNKHVTNQIIVTDEAKNYSNFKAAG